MGLGPFLEYGDLAVAAGGERCPPTGL